MYALSIDYMFNVRQRSILSGYRHIIPVHIGSIRPTCGPFELWKVEKLSGKWLNDSYYLRIKHCTPLHQVHKCASFASTVAQRWLLRCNGCSTPHGSICVRYVHASPSFLPWHPHPPRPLPIVQSQYSAASSRCRVCTPASAKAVTWSASTPNYTTYNWLQMLHALSNNVRSIESSFLM